MTDPKEIKSGYVIEFGRYYYDNKPTIGQLGDINMWDRVLEKEEMEMFSGCLDLVKVNGNIINEEFEFNITGKLVTNMNIPDSEVSCLKMWSNLYIPVHMAGLGNANDLCDKIEVNSIGPKIVEAKDYIDFYNGILELPAFHSRCWHGS